MPLSQLPLSGGADSRSIWRAEAQNGPSGQRPTAQALPALAIGDRMIAR